MGVVYVLNKNGNPLMPTTRCGHVRLLLKSGKAVVVKQVPFTIKLKYQTQGEKQRIILGIDPGRTNIGVCAVTESGESLFSANMKTNNADVPKRMQERLMYRRNSRNGERKRRQRRARKCDTIFKDGKTRERLLPGCSKPITNLYIKNSEARFNNRKRPSGWLTPTARHLLEVTINGIKKVQQSLPIADIVIEVNRFAFMAMDDPRIKKWQYQRGPLYGYGSIFDAVAAQQDGHCIFCDHSIEHCHHVVPKHKGGSNTLANYVGLCANHHALVHTNEKWAEDLAAVKAGMNKKYHALSVLNQIMPYLLERISELFPSHVYVTEGCSTKAFRDEHGVAKDHYLDAYCIACSILDVQAVIPPVDHYQMIKFRQHDRAATSRLESRKYYLNGKLVAKNRHKSFEQKDDSLAEFIAAHQNDVSRLIVKAGGPKYKDVNRILRGAIFRMPNGKEVVLRGRHGRSKNGKTNYYEFYGIDKMVTPRNCTYVHKGRGWQFVPSGSK